MCCKPRERVAPRSHRRPGGRPCSAGGAGALAFRWRWRSGSAPAVRGPLEGHRHRLARRLRQVAPEEVARVARLAGDEELRRQQLARAELTLTWMCGVRPGVGTGRMVRKRQRPSRVAATRPKPWKAGSARSPAPPDGGSGRRVALPDLDLRTAQRAAVEVGQRAFDQAGWPPRVAQRAVAQQVAVAVGRQRDRVDGPSVCAGVGAARRGAVRVRQPERRRGDQGCGDGAPRERPRTGRRSAQPWAVGAAGRARVPPPAAIFSRYQRSCTPTAPWTEDFTRASPPMLNSCPARRTGWRPAQRQRAPPATSTERVAAGAGEGVEPPGR